ncbi:restriction endonuclease subunit S [Gardnerella vaginalis]|uniref:restriction endonuclease subunit S n=1 Tax=Gardnerella sp. KA01002 TaxID=2749082 RepID=UPI0025508EEB|nr:restriction endonuclease subunit S [Gardnerella vaginalis]MDK8328541.1 restriction endonuclease subunit S [Gardnerella vaginalis]
MGLSRYKLGELIEQCDERNDKLKYTLKDVKGISIQKIFIETKADMKDVSLNPYKLVQPDNFAYVTVTSRNGEKITLAHNTTINTYIVSSSYIVFKVNRTDLLSSDFLYIYFNRPEFDRYSRFNSWGSARETFSWDDMCDMDIDLPPLAIQQKYVNVYNAMVANQKAYERGLDDLKLTCDALIDNYKHKSTKKSVGDILQEVDVRNVDGIISNVQGINITKQFMPSVANTNGVDLSKYKLVSKGQFAFSGMQTGRDECIRIALFDKEEPIIISPAYSILQIKDDNVLAEYVMMWFSRKELDRLGWFMSDASIRTNLDMDRFYEIEIPVPDLEVQKAIIDIYNAYNVRRAINEKLKAQIKDICPILIKGSIEEGRNTKEA